MYKITTKHSYVTVYTTKKREFEITQNCGQYPMVRKKSKFIITINIFEIFLSILLMKFRSCFSN